MLKLTVCALALLATTGFALAQQVPAGGGGGQLQQIPRPPVLEKSIPEIRNQAREPEQIQNIFGDKILVKSLHVSGARIFTEAELIAAAHFKPNSELDLAALRKLVSGITEYYNKRGYFVAQAYLPAQEIKDGAVTIAVIEGRYGKVSLNNKSRLSNRVAHNEIDDLKPGDAVAIAPLERRILLLSDMPGVGVKSTVTPGGSVGTSDLIVDLTPEHLVTGDVEGDNAGNRYTGEYRLGGAVNLNDLAGLGDVLTLRGVTSFSGLNYVRASYQVHVYDATVGAAYAHMDYRLGREFAPLKATGTADIGSVYSSYPLIRSHNSDLYAILDFDAKDLNDKVGVTFTSADRRVAVLNLGLTGDEHDRIGGGGWTFYSANWARGDIHIRTPAVLVIDRATAMTSGQYDKIVVEAARLQNIFGPLSAYVAFRGQVSSKNLDLSEKMELGGAYGVRAYAEGESYGDKGYVLNAEARLQLPKLWKRMPGQMQLVGFVDIGSVTLYERPWVTGPNNRTLSGAGVGLTWSDFNNFSLKASYAGKLGNAVATSGPDRPGRFWIQITKFF